MKTEILAKPEEYRYRVTDFRLYDGDTYTCLCHAEHKIKGDTGFRRFITLNIDHEEPITVRLYDVDTPELRDKRPAFKAAGYLAKQAVVDWAENAKSRGGCFFLSQGYTKGKYGLPMGDLLDNEGRRVSDYLVSRRLAVPYYGQNKASIQAQHQENIEYLIENGEIEQ